MAVYRKYKNILLIDSKEVILLYIALVPWGLMVVLSTMVELSQVKELVLSNAVFLLFCIFYVKEEFQRIRAQESDIKIQNAKILYLQDLLNAELNKGIEHIEPEGSIFEEKDILNDNFDKNIFDENSTQLPTIQPEIVKISTQELSVKEITNAYEVKEDSVKKPINKIIEEQNEKLSFIEDFRNPGTILDIEDIQQDTSIFKAIKKDITNNDFDENLFYEDCAQYLTSVQIEVIKLIKKGLTYKQIAIVRKVEEDSIKKLMSRVRRQLRKKGKLDILRKIKIKKH